MKTYNGYTEEEIKEMENEGTIDTSTLIAYVNGDYDGCDDWFDDEYW